MTKRKLFEYIAKKGSMSFREVKVLTHQEQAYLSEFISCRYVKLRTNTPQLQFEYSVTLKGVLAYRQGKLK